MLLSRPCAVRCRGARERVCPRRDAIELAVWRIRCFGDDWSDVASGL